MLLKGKTIFLVEDDPVNLAVTRVVLTNQGATVPYDHWGDTALAKLRSYSTKLDLILLDIMLSGKVDGFDIFDVIRADPLLVDIPIVAVTAADADSVMPKAQAKGFDGYISKPIDRHQFPLSMLKILAGEKLWDAHQ